uniref:Uncharacterized protein n=1 Tax=Anguilla anguilla TaxID=7936 RepID=A0A0E9SHR1_ANGAN
MRMVFCIDLNCMNLLSNSHNSNIHLESERECGLVLYTIHIRNLDHYNSVVCSWMP